MTEPTPAEDAVPATPELELQFRGRAVWVKMPGLEQLLVWKRTIKQLQGADVSGWNGEQVMKALERTRLIIDSVIVHDTDKEWLDDQLLEGSIGLRETAEIINGTVELFAAAAEAEGNRETRRAAKKAAPAKKAARKKPAPR